VVYLKVVQVKYRNEMVSSYLHNEHKYIHGRYVNVKCRYHWTFHWCV